MCEQDNTDWCTYMPSIRRATELTQCCTSVFLRTRTNFKYNERGLPQIRALSILMVSIMFFWELLLASTYTTIGTIHRSDGLSKAVCSLVTLYSQHSTCKTNLTTAVYGTRLVANLFTDGMPFRLGLLHADIRSGRRHPYRLLRESAVLTRGRRGLPRVILGYESCRLLSAYGQNCSSGSYVCA
jgi:hypothetical protein